MEAYIEDLGGDYSEQYSDMEVLGGWDWDYKQNYEMYSEDNLEDKIYSKKNTEQRDLNLNHRTESLQITANRNRYPENQGTQKSFLNQRTSTQK